MDVKRAGWIGGALVLAFALPFGLGQPYWQGNDDVLIAMVAHGYGVTSLPSVALSFSSVLYGMLIQAVGTPSIAGAQVYGVFTYALLAGAAIGTAYALWRAGVSGGLGAAALLIVFAPVVLYPQFTVVAGLPVVAGSLLLAVGGMGCAAAAAVLFALGALVRFQEAALTLAFTLPFLWPKLRSVPRLSALAVLAAVAIASVIADRLYYGAPAWEYYVAMNEARVRFTDWGLRQYFFREPLDAMRLGWVPNDLVMVEGWFFADPRVYTPARLNELTSHVDPLWLALSNAKRYDEALEPFRHEHFLALLGLAVFAAWRARSRVALWSLAALGGVMVLIMLAGRPGVMRIYIPPLAAIALFAVTLQPAPLARLHAIVLGIGIAVAGTVLALRNVTDRAEEQLARAKLCRLPADRLHVVWGDALPFERIYRPLAPPGDGCTLAIYPLGVHSYAPYAVERLRAATGAGDVVQALLDGREIDMIASGWQVDVLRRHLRIHYNKILTWRLIDGDGHRGSRFRLRIA